MDRVVLLLVLIGRVLCPINSHGFRVHDIDVIEAVAIASASVGEPNGASAQLFRAGSGVGNIIPPTRAVILRKMPNGQQVAIRVDLIRAMKRPFTTHFYSAR